MDFTSARPEDLLFDAARRGDVATLRELLATGLDVNLTNPKGFTALTLATYDDHREAATFLLGAGADLAIKDARGLTALHLAGQQGNAEAWALLGGEDEQR